MHRLLREPDLCKGGDKQQRGCPLAQKVHCAECGYEWVSDEDLGTRGQISKYSGNCPSCSSSAILLLRCDVCPVAELERVRANTSAGRLLERVLELDFDTKRFDVRWDEVTAEEAIGLRVLEDERGKYTNEVQERRQEEAEMERRVQEAQRRQRGGV